MGLQKLPVRTGSDRFPVGSAHGRFQPLHYGHLEYLLAAKARCDFLWIGITQFDISSLARSPADRHRESPVNNPLTYFERAQIIIAALLEQGLTRDDFAICPFPVDNPASLTNFLPPSVPVFTTVCDQWNHHKIQVLRQLGYEVIVLWERAEKKYDGMKVRRQILEGNPAWRKAVPPAAQRLLDEYLIENRLLSLHRGSESHERD